EEHPSLLVALEAHHVEVEYLCRDGYSGSTRCRLVAGQVHRLTEPLAFNSQGEILSIIHNSEPTRHMHVWPMRS
ncbi:hypothetical protein ACVGX7_00355, partial [Enterobacter hormaechei]